MDWAKVCSGQLTGGVAQGSCPFKLDQAEICKPFKGGLKWWLVAFIIPDRENAVVRITIVAVMILSISGCANWNSIYRTHKFAIDDRSLNAESVILDIQQREILVGNGTICPAPSPDALAAYAAQLAAKGEVPSGAKGEVATAVQTSAAYVGVRSRNIQFFRDQLYSFCLDRMNDTLDDAQYNFYKSRLQRYAVALAAVEQLTDSTIAPPVVLGSQGEAAVSGNLDALRAKLDATNKDIEKIEKEGGPKADGKELTADETAKLKELKDNKKTTEASIRNATLLSASGQSSGQIGQTTEFRNQPSNEVVKAVTKIVVTTLMTDDTPLLCLERLINIENRPILTDRRSDGSYTQTRPPIDAAQQVEVDYCKKVLLNASGESNPIQTLDPKLKDWLIGN